jgi:hypothetical protein
MMRKIRAFFQAIVLTLQGKTVERPYGKLLDWIERGQALADDALKAVEASPVDGDAVVVRADGRDQSMTTILKTVQYHFNEEFPYMLHHPTQHVITAIYATNMNDSYAVARLKDQKASDDPTLSRLVEKLSNHLETIPPSNSLSTQ